MGRRGLAPPRTPQPPAFHDAGRGHFATRFTICVIVGVIAAAAAGFAAPAAHADFLAIADDGQDPWASGLSASPVEALAGQLASRLANRSVAIQCASPDAWNEIGSLYHFDPSSTFGITPAPFGVPLNFAVLAPSICLSLKQFALSVTKPTKCPVTTYTDVTTDETVRTWQIKRVVVWVRVKGRRVKHTVARRIPIDTTTPVTTQVPSTSFVPCYTEASVPAAPMGEDYWRAYLGYSLALETLAHESIHLAGVRSESVAECYGMQATAATAMLFGAAADDAQAIARFFWDRLYASRPHDDGYWSPDCVDGGPLDARRDTTTWP